MFFEYRSWTNTSGNDKASITSYIKFTSKIIARMNHESCDHYFFVVEASLFFHSERFYTAISIKIKIYKFFHFIVFFFCFWDRFLKHFTYFWHFLFFSATPILFTESNSSSPFIFTEFSIFSWYSLNLSLSNFWLNTTSISCL